MYEFIRSPVCFCWLLGFLVWLTLQSAFAQEAGGTQERPDRRFKLGIAASAISARNEPAKLSPPVFLGLAAQWVPRRYSGNPFLRAELGTMTDGAMSFPYCDFFGGSYFGRRDFRPFLGAGWTYPYGYYFWGTGVAYKKRIMLGVQAYSANPGKMYSLELCWFPRRKPT